MAMLREFAAHACAPASSLRRPPLHNHDGATAQLLQLRFQGVPQLGVSHAGEWSKRAKFGRKVARAWGGEGAGAGRIVEEGDGGVAEDRGWTVEDSSALYRLHGWGVPYFAINDSGHLCARPSGTVEGRDEVDVMEVINSLAAQDLQLPVILRFPDMLRHRMRELQGCFSSAMIRFGYQRHFEGVFPIKCNPECHLLDQFVEFGFGLEVGSKPELLIALSKLSSRAGALLICNGYKDSVYVENVILATRLGIRAVLVLEQIEELEEVVSCSKRLGIRPIIGVRAKLSTKHNGHWGGTSGDKAKFGLTVTEIVSVVYRLRQEGMLECLELLHFHMGSQISSILAIKEAMREASHTYCELALMGAPMGYIDVGGGLGIDYDGSKGQSSASVNYSMQNYANDVVAALMDACVLKGVAEPVVVSESGRALASHSSVLVFDVLHAHHHIKKPGRVDKVLEEERLQLDPLSNGHVSTSQSHDAGEYLLSTFHQVYATLELGNAQEAYNDAKQLRQEAGSLFKLGCLSLEQRAQADILYEKVCQQVLGFGSQLPKEFKLSLPSIYTCNMSVFRSVPDSWAIEQIFPVMPLHRLNEKPSINAILADLTCDSDGKIDRFLGPSGETSSVLALHTLQKAEPYYLGLFLGGVYQEMLGSAHNLFGGVHVVHLRALGDGDFAIDHVLPGQTAGQVLSGTYHCRTELLRELVRQASSSVAAGKLSQKEANLLTANYQRCLDSYTYFSMLSDYTDHNSNSNSLLVHTTALGQVE
ncbi:hypothetical protein M758_5G043300 [Ceratodon purpureus]|nr:hypothetical protein M758_5G043300 [Ceratodon purpureus]